MANVLLLNYFKTFEYHQTLKKVSQVAKRHVCNQRQTSRMQLREKQEFWPFVPQLSIQISQIHHAALT